MTTLEAILNQRQLVDTGIKLNGRSHVRKVLANDEQALVLKTDKIDIHQVALLLAASKSTTSRSFSTQKIFHPDNASQPPEYLLLEYIQGSELKEFYRDRLAEALTISETICNDYQIFIKECQAAEIIPSKPNNEVAYSWLGRMFHHWVRRIIERKLLTENEAFSIISTLFALADEDPEHFFGYNHGNIHGEHIIIAQDGAPYLLDLTIEPRPGTAFYDHLRVLDFALLAHPDPESALPEIVARLKKLKTQHNPTAVQAVWAFRCIGLLGADILGNDTRATASDYPVREQIALAMIRNQY